MISDVQICNMALGRIATEAISDLLTDEGSSAVSCRIFYGPDRDAVLRSFDWSWAVKRQVLAPTTDPNLTGITNAYTLPADPYCLRVLEIFDSGGMPTGMPYQVEGRTLYTEQSGVVLKYIARIEDVALYDETFIDALAWRLAADLIGPLNGTSLVEPMTMFRAIIEDAKGVDAQARQEAAPPSDRWIDSRFRHIDGSR